MGKNNFSRIFRRLYQFFIAVFTNQPKLSDLKQHRFVFTQSGGQKSHPGLTDLKSGVSRSVFFLEVLGQNPSPCLSRSYLHSLVHGSSHLQSPNFLTVTSVSIVLTSPSLTLTSFSCLLLSLIGTIVSCLLLGY